MKKIYLMTAFLCASSFAFNQTFKNATKPSKVVQTKKVSQTPNATKDVGVSIWQDDFSDSTEWTIGRSEPQGDWEIGVEADLPNPAYYSAIQSSTAANGFAFFEGVQWLLGGNPLNQNAWIEMTNSVDLSAHQYVNFSFEQNYRAFNSDNTIVEVSINGGTTWEQAIDVNVDVVDNGPSNITVPFEVSNSTTVKFRFRWESLEANAGYAWQVDDVDISSLPDNDIKVSNTYKGTGEFYYHQIPEVQIQPISFRAEISNVGLNDQSNVAYQAEEAGQGYSEISSSATYAYGVKDSIGVSPQFTPSGQGSYDVELAILNDSIDDIPSNNSISTYSFEVGEYIYARDNNIPDGRVDGTLYDPSEVVEPATLYDIYANADLTAIDITFGSTLDTGVTVFGRIYGLKPDLTIEENPIAETEEYITLASDGEDTEVTLMFASPVSLEAGKQYVLSAKCYAVGFSIRTAGQSPFGTSLKFGDLGGGGEAWYNEPATPMIRMRFEETTAVESNELSNLNVGNSYPNPFANTTTVEFNLNEAAEVSYSVVDMAGKEVASSTVGNKIAGEHKITIDGTSFANGVYYLKMTAGDALVTRKLVVNK